MGKSVNLSVPLLGKWRTFLESRDIYDVLGYLVQIPLHLLFMLGTLCLALQITWRKIRPLHTAKPQRVLEEDVEEPPREITIKELETFNGLQKNKIYVAINHKVFDVTSAWEYFGPEGPDSSLAGREASRALVALTLRKDNNKLDDFTDFNSMQLDYLFELETQYRERYHFVGELVEKKQPKLLQKLCAEVIRNALQTRSNSGLKNLEGHVGQLPLPKRIQHEILDNYRKEY